MYCLEVLPQILPEFQFLVFLQFNCSCLQDPHIARVLGLGTSGPGPHFVVMEYLEHGDLTSFLASHLPEDTPFLLPATRTLSFPTLVYMAAQVILRALSKSLRAVR